MFDKLHRLSWSVMLEIRTQWRIVALDLQRDINLSKKISTFSLKIDPKQPLRHQHRANPL